MVNNNELRVIHELREQGIDWDTIYDTIPNCTDNDRKLYYGYKLGLEEENDSSLLKHAKTLQTIRVERKKLGVERSINNEQVRDIALHQTFTDQVLDAVNVKYKDFEIVERPEIYREEAHIFTLADFHFDGDETYLEVLNRATREIIKVIKEKNLQEIYLFELGDTLEGASLRNSQLMGIKKGMVMQTMMVADAYIKLIGYLSEFVTVKFYSVDSSNHTQLRNLGTKQNQLIEEDLMIIFNKIIETALPNLDFTHDKEMFPIIKGFTFFIAHSHEARGNAIKYIKDVQTERSVLIDYSVFGHRHHMESIDINSGIGYDKKLLFVPSLSTKASQFEKQNNLSSQAGVGYYVFKEGKGLVEERKLQV